MKLNVKLIDGAPLPRHARAGDAGLDLTVNRTITIAEGETVLVGTGVRVELPEGFYGLIAPRSGYASRFGVTLANTPSIIDSGYRGEIMLALYRLPSKEGNPPLRIPKGTRVAQMVVNGFLACECVEGELGETERNLGGFGSTGM